VRLVEDLRGGQLQLDGEVEDAPGGILDFAVELELPASEVLDEADGTLSVDFTDAEGSAATASADTRVD